MPTNKISMLKSDDKNYSEQLTDILENLENKEKEVAGGSVVGIVLSTVNSLIIYIANLTIGKKKYENVQEKIYEILEKAEKLKQQSLKSIDTDVKILQELLDSYKKRKENQLAYQEACIKATKFALEVIELALKTEQLSEEISKVGNKMLASDFKICKYYAQTSIEASKENLYVNLNGIKDEACKKAFDEKYQEILNKYKK